jgi:hypothetical protein
VDGQGEGGSDGGTSMALVTGDENREGEAMVCVRFWRGGGEVAPRCRRRMTQRRAAWQLWRSKAAAGFWRSKMTKGNWVGGPNARLN